LQRSALPGHSTDVLAIRLFAARSGPLNGRPDFLNSGPSRRLPDHRRPGWGEKCRHRRPRGGSYAGQLTKEPRLPSRDLHLGAASQLDVQSPIHSKIYAFDVFEIDDLLAVGTKEPLGIQTRFEA
jgi:hypothetical protein